MQLHLLWENIYYIKIRQFLPYFYLHYKLKMYCDKKMEMFKCFCLKKQAYSGKIYG